MTGRGWASHGPEAVAREILVALVKSEPEWRVVTLDYGDVRQGGAVEGGSPERLTCANYHSPEEVQLPAPEVHCFLAREGLGVTPLAQIRRLRAQWATAHMLCRRDPDPPEATPFDACAEIEQAQAAGDDAVEPAAVLVQVLLRSLPGPWELTRVARSPTTGGLWGFGVNHAGDLAMASHDVESRRVSAPPVLMWLPRQGQAVLHGFLTDRLCLEPKCTLADQLFGFM